jgi:LysM repeat protein
MQSFRQIGAGILLAVISVVIVLGGLALALAEGGMIPASPTDLPDENTPPGEIVTVFPTLPLPIFTNTPPGLGLTATITLTPPPTLTNCPPPAGWLPIVIQSFDTLDSLAQTYRTTVDLLRVNNCLLNDQLIANSILYVPPLPTPTLVPCGAPPNWGNYTVVAGDTLYRIGLLYRVTPEELMRANCLTTSVIRVGQTLKVPNVPTSTSPVISITNTPIPTQTATGTSSIILTPSLPAPSPTGTITQTPPATEIPTTTMTPLPTDTLTPTFTPVTPGA